LKILVIGKFYSDSFGQHIKYTLSNMGHQVEEYEVGFNVDPKKHKFGMFFKMRNRIYSSLNHVPCFRRYIFKALKLKTEKQQPELIIVCHDLLWPSEVDALKNISGAKIVMWFPDALVNFRGYFFTAAYDCLFFKDPYIVHALKSVLRSKVCYLPECFNESAYEAAASTKSQPEYECQITTAGNIHGYRVAFFANLMKYDVKIWGYRPPFFVKIPKAVDKMYQKKPVLEQDKFYAFTNAKIVVNNLHYSEIWGLNARAFEVAGTGGFQLVDWRPGINQLFEDGKEIVTFRGIDDLKEKIDYYLIHDEDRTRIADAGRQRAVKEHTYKHRLKLLMDTLEGREDGYPMPSILG
jgi:spore maturation protein CgeB